MREDEDLIKLIDSSIVTGGTFDYGSPKQCQRKVLSEIFPQEQPPLPETLPHWHKIGKDGKETSSSDNCKKCLSILEKWVTRAKSLDMELDEAKAERDHFRKEVAALKAQIEALQHPLIKCEDSGVEFTK